MRIAQPKNIASLQRLGVSKKLSDLLDPRMEANELLATKSDLSTDDIQLLNDIAVVAPDLDSGIIGHVGDGVAANPFDTGNANAPGGQPNFDVRDLPANPLTNSDGPLVGQSILANSLSGLGRFNPQLHAINNLRSAATSNHSTQPSVTNMIDELLTRSDTNQLSKSQQLLGNDFEATGHKELANSSGNSAIASSDAVAPALEPSRYSDKHPQEKPLRETVGIPESEACQSRSKLLIQKHREERVFRAAIAFHHKELLKDIRQGEFGVQDQRWKQFLINTIKALIRTGAGILNRNSWKEVITTVSKGGIQDFGLSQIKVNQSIKVLEEIKKQREKYIRELEKAFRKSRTVWNELSDEHKQAGCKMDASRMNDFSKISQQDIMKVAYP